MIVVKHTDSCVRLSGEEKFNTTVLTDDDKERAFRDHVAQLREVRSKWLPNQIVGILTTNLQTEEIGRI